MGLKYVFNSYLDLLFTFGACPVCAPKRHTQRLKIGEFSKIFCVFQALGVPFGCTYWERASHPKCAQYESITYLNIIGQLLDLNFVCWFKLGLPKGRHLFNESHIYIQVVSFFVHKNSTRAVSKNTKNSRIFTIS